MIDRSLVAKQRWVNIVCIYMDNIVIKYWLNIEVFAFCQQWQAIFCHFTASNSNAKPIFNQYYFIIESISYEFNIDSNTKPQYNQYITNIGLLLEFRLTLSHFLKQ